MKTCQVLCVWCCCGSFCWEARSSLEAGCTSCCPPVPPINLSVVALLCLLKDSTRLIACRCLVHHHILVLSRTPSWAAAVSLTDESLYSSKHHSAFVKPKWRGKKEEISYSPRAKVGLPARAKHLSLDSHITSWLLKDIQRGVVIVVAGGEA